VPVGLGNDWTATNNSNDLLVEARIAALVGKMIAGNPTVLPVTQMIRMLTIEGAYVLGIDHLVGSIEVGKRADLTILDLNRVEMAPSHNLASTCFILQAYGRSATFSWMVKSSSGAEH
jgi:5-methylthioadenosine/S-adenosylhomocysteine deaminase